jgi:hypothetical protein
MFETGVLDEGSQILNAAKSHFLVLAFLRALEIGNDQAPAGFEHTRDFRENLCSPISFFHAK